MGFINPLDWISWAKDLIDIDKGVLITGDSLEIKHLTKSNHSIPFKSLIMVVS